MRFGIGYDIHRLAEGRPLVLGGKTIPYNLGPDGHSDADVLTHAVIDGLLGAAGLGDIGKIFGVDRQETKNISSLVLLKRTMELIRRAGYSVNNMDATIVAERPKLSEHTVEMRKNLAEILEISPERVNIKTSTTQGLGETGNCLAIEVYAVVSINEDEKKS